MARGGKKQSDAEEERRERQKAHGKGCCHCGSIESDGGVVVFLNLLSFAAGVAMSGVGGLLIYNAVDKGAHMSVDRWIVTIYSVLMGILVIASSGTCRHCALRPKPRRPLSELPACHHCHTATAGSRVRLTSDPSFCGGASVHITFILREFRFMSKMFGRGLLYIFVGVYYLNVVSGGVESTSDADAASTTACTATSQTGCVASRHTFF